MVNLQLIPNEEKYYEFVRNLRNDPRVKPGFIAAEHITAERQFEYMSIYKDCYHICLCDNEPAGYVGVVNGDIRIATLPDFQNRGIASYMLSCIKIMYPSAFAKIKIDNEYSLKTFKRAGYKIKYYLLELEESK